MTTVKKFELFLKMARRLAPVILAVAGTLWSAGADGVQRYRPEKAKRSLNTDQYTLSIQRDDCLDLHTLDGLPVVENAYPSVTLSGEPPRALPVDYQQSERIGVRTALGKGNGFRFKTKSCEWLVGVYPGQTFLTVDLIYTNTGRQPEQVAGLTPWTLGERGRGALYVGPAGTGSVGLLQHATASDSFARFVAEADRSAGPVAAYNRTTGDGLIAGFLTHGAGRGYVRMASPLPDTENGFGRFDAWCEFKPPVTLAPGEQLRADTLYVAIREPDLAAGLNRFTAASARLEPFASAPPDQRHGWYVRQTPAMDVDGLRSAMAALGADVDRHGWRHVILGPGWLAPEGIGTAGLRALVAHAHAQGLTLGVTLPVPEGTDEPALSALVAACQEAGVDGIELPAHGRIADLAGKAPGDPEPVYVPPLVAGATVLGDWALASRHFYLAGVGNPGLLYPSKGLVQDGAGLRDEQFVTAYSVASLSGARLRPATPFHAQPSLRQQVLRQLRPGLHTVARPVDLFQHEPPAQWYLPLKAEAGVWTIAGLFNWDVDGTRTHELPLTRIGLNPGVTYTVYDFWAGQYLGRIRDRLRVEVPAGGVRLLGLRYAEQRPMFVATNRDFTQGATDHQAITWTHETSTLSGRFEADAGFPYTLTLYVPAPYRLDTLTCSEAIARQDTGDETVQFSVTPEEDGEVTWTLTFDAGG